MLEAFKRILSPEYLVVAEPGPLGSLWVLYLALGLLFATGLAAAPWVLAGPGRRVRPPAQRIWAWFTLWTSLAGLGTVLGRFLSWSGWSARIWPYTLAALVMAGSLVYFFRRTRLPPWLVRQLRILALSPPQASPEARPALAYALGLILHLAGIALILRSRYQQPVWLAPLLLLVVILPQLPSLARRRWPDLLALTPLLAAYAATLLWLLYRSLGITVIGWQGLAFPNPLLSLFYLDGIVLSAVVYAHLCQVAILARELARPAVLWRGAAAALLALTLIWASAVYLGKRTHGATASDPYAYAQMAVDLAERGTFLHRFRLFQEVMPLNIAWAPLQPVGYHIPRNELGDCPSVWATGASVLLAAGYRLLGEAGLYVTTPVVGLLALAATWALAHEALLGQSPGVRHVTAALTVALLATSPEYVDRLLVPMADASALLFTVLALFFALRGMHRLGSGRPAVFAFLLAGASFAAAYWVRHTQLVLVLPLLLALFLGYQMQRNAGPRRRQSSLVPPLLAFLGAALLVALPDIAYRWRTFGGPLATETTELPLMALQYLAPVARQMLGDALVAGEWGYLFPLAVYGSYRLFRDRPRETLVLGSALALVLLVHLTYRSLRLRDLISLFAFVDLAVAYGAVALVQRVRALSSTRDRTRLGTALLSSAAIAGVVLSLGLARWAMVDNLWRPGWASFGYMRPVHRAAFDRLAELTPPQAVIGASLNAGAVMMYTGRDAIRPYDSWTEAEWAVFLEAMADLGRPVYLLDDGSLMADFIARQTGHRSLVPIEELTVPLFYTRDRLTGWLYLLEGTR
jgi:hypothetical protein